MATGWCRACGAELPTAAAFCSRCGAPADDVPVLPLVGEASPATPDGTAEGPPAGSARTLVGIVVGVLIVLVVMSTLAGGGDDGSEAAEAPTSTTRRPPPSTTTPRPSAPAVPGSFIEPDATLPAGLEMVAIVDSREGGVLVVDLATGVQVELPEPAGTIHTAVWSGEVVLVQADRGLFRLAGDPSAPWTLVERGGDEFGVGWLDWNGLAMFQGESPWGEPTMVRADGSVQSWSIPPSASRQLWRYGGPRGAVDERLVLETSDGIYGIDQAGAVDRISYGRVVGLGHGRLLVHRCDAALRCEQVLLDADGGVVRRLPDTPHDLDPWMGGVAPDGDTVWVVGGSHSGLGDGMWIAPGGEWTAVGGGVPTSPYGGVVWTSDSTQVAWWDQSTASIVVIDLADLTAPPVEIRTNRRVARGADMGEVVVLVPRDAVPEALRPPR